MQIKEIRDISGSHIKILPPDELPPCALSNDRVVQCACLLHIYSYGPSSPSVACFLAAAFLHGCGGHCRATTCETARL